MAETRELPAGDRRHPPGLAQRQAGGRAPGVAVPAARRRRLLVAPRTLHGQYEGQSGGLHYLIFFICTSPLQKSLTRVYAMHGFGIGCRRVRQQRGVPWGPGDLAVLEG